MADYSQAKYDYDVLTAQEKANTSPDVEWEISTRRNTDMDNERRITSGHVHYNSGGLASGGWIGPTMTIPALPTVRHRAEFNSQNAHFTVAELKHVLGKLNHPSANIIFESIDGISPDGKSANPITKAVVEWEA